MSGIIVLFELWSLLLICTLVGKRLVSLLPIKIQHQIGFYISPVLGLAALLLIATLYGWIIPYDFKITLNLTLLLIFIAFVFERKKSIFLKDFFYICAFSTICALPVLAPIFRFGGYNPFTDIFTYLVQAQWLQEHAFTEKVITSGNFPALTQVALYQITGSRMGGSFFLGFVQSLFNFEWSYYAYTATVASALVVGCLALGGVVRNVVPSSKTVILALSLIPSLMMNGYIYGAEWGFYPQTLGLSFALGVCAIFPCITKNIIESNLKARQIFIYSLPIAICFSALLFAYNEPFPVFVASIGLFIIIAALQGRKHPNALKNLSIFTSIFIIQTLALVNYEAIRIFINIYQTLTISQGNADIGWPVLWSPIQFMAFSFGMKSPFNNRTFSFDYFYSTFFTTILIIATFITLFSFLRTHPKRRENIIFLLCFELILFIFFIKFRYFAIDKSALEVGHTFLQFKISKYMAPFSLSLLAIFAAFCYHKVRAKRDLFLIAYGTLFIIGTFFHVKISAKNYTNDFLNRIEQRKNPFDVLLKLRESLENIPKDKVIYVDLGYENSKLRQMVAYILYDRKIASDYRDDGYILGRLPENERNMSKDGAVKCVVMRSADFTGNIVGPFLIKDCSN